MKTLLPLQRASAAAANRDQEVVDLVVVSSMERATRRQVVDAEMLQRVRRQQEEADMSPEMRSTSTSRTTGRRVAIHEL